MTFAVSSPCKHPGCAALVASGAGSYCPAHRRAAPEATHRRQADRFRGTAAARGYDADWKRQRFDFLARWPLCPGVLLPTPQWTPELAQHFHTLRDDEHLAGRLLIFSPVSHQSILSRCCAWLQLYPIYRLELWDVALPATVVDHIIPHKGDPLLMWAQWNWQPLSKRAHDRKTATEKAAEFQTATP